MNLVAYRQAVVDHHHHSAGHSGSDAHAGHGAGHGGKTHAAAQGQADTGVAAPIRHLASASGFTSAMNVYWHTITAAKSHHQFVVAFPPVYSGMDDPRVVAGKAGAGTDSLASPGHMASLADLLSASKDLNRIATRQKKEPDFQISQINEAEFKKRYAAESVFVGKQFGIDKNHMANLVKHIYAFEDGGWGTHYTLSSMPPALMDDANTKARLNFHPLSSAIGYNQLLTRDTVNDIIQHGQAIADRLELLARENPSRAAEIHAKSVLVEQLQDELTHKPLPKGSPKPTFHDSESKVERAIQALNLDGDVGPVIQSQELYNLLKFANDNKFDEYLSIKARMETSHATEYNALPPDKKAAAVQQLFALIKPTELHPDDPAADAAFNATKASLLKKFEALGPSPNNSPLSRDHLTDDEFHMMNSQVLTIRRYGGANGPISPEARALLDRATYDYFGGFSADQLKAAAIELANLAGMGTASSMLQPEHSNLPTSNFFARNGYQGNPVTSRRSVDELIMQIVRVMRGPNSEAKKPGNSQFDAAYAFLDHPQPHK